MTIPEKNENKGVKAVVRDRRRVEVAQDLKDGLNVTESAKSIGVSRETIYKDRKAIMGKFQGEANETMQEYRAEVLIKLAEIESLVSDPTVDKIDKAKVLLDVVKQLRAIYGTDAATKTITANFNADVDPEQLVGYRRFVYETRGLDRDAIESVYQYARQLARPDTIESDPPQESELWEEGS